MRSVRPVSGKAVAEGGGEVRPPRGDLSSPDTEMEEDAS